MSVNSMNEFPISTASQQPQASATLSPSKGSYSPRASESARFDVQERPYTEKPNFTKNATSLKHRWEQAPRGRVFHFSKAIETSAARRVSGGIDPDEGDALLAGQETNYEMQNAGGDSHYTPGVEEHTLDELRATSIAGNDISSSCLYATGIVANSAGKYAPFSSAMVCIVLYWFRKIYSEVFSALPMNGGTYNALLNTSNKNMAALAAVLSTISYTATAVTSAASAGDYLNYGWDFIPSKWVCIGILVFFAMLTLMGIKDSANTATALFILHLSTMASLVIGSLIFVIKDGGVTLKNSWNSTSLSANPQQNVGLNLFYGYCSALLGVTGFESSSNYIEEQREGVFPKTLRNMWIAITAINPALAVLAMGVIPIEDLVANQNYSLAAVGSVAIGDWFKTLIVIDAALVLAGAVLTAYVGITGLHRRLALDRIMPHFFLDVNKWRKSNHWIIITFCILTCSLRLLVDNMNTLGGVYAIAFLGVMSLFCVSNFLLKFKRGKLPRNPIANPVMVFLAFAMVVAGIVGNMIKAPENGEWFSVYFVVFGVAVVATKLRVTVLRLLIRMIPKRYSAFRDKVEQKVHDLRSFPIVFFVKEPNLHTMNKAIHYIIENEETKSIKIVHMDPTGGRAAYESPRADGAPTLSVETPNGNPQDSKIVFVATDDMKREESTATVQEDAGCSPHTVTVRKQLEDWCTILDELYPKITIDVLFVDEEFSPASVHNLSEQLGIPRNYMFMTCPSNKFNHTIGHLGGVRVIQH